MVQTIIFALITTTILHKLLKASLWCACGNAEVPFNKQKIVNQEHTLLSDESNNQRCSQSYRTCSSPCYASRSILDAGLQICLQCTYNTRRTGEKKDKKAKEQRLKDCWGRGGQRTTGGHFIYGEEEAKAGGQRKIYQ